MWIPFCCRIMPACWHCHSSQKKLALKGGYMQLNPPCRLESMQPAIVVTQYWEYIVFFYIVVGSTWKNLSTTWKGLPKISEQTDGSKYSSLFLLLSVGLWDQMIGRKFIPQKQSMQPWQKFAWLASTKKLYVIFRIFKKFLWNNINRLLLGYLRCFNCDGRQFWIFPW